MPEAVALGFDTSSAHCAAVLFGAGRVLAFRHDEMVKGQAEYLFPMLEEMLAETELNWRDLDVIGVGTGPGNFTGIRVAVSAARGLALSLGIPAIGVSVTEALAFGLPRPCRVVIPAKRDQLIWQDFYSDKVEKPQQAASGSLPPGPSQMAPAVPLAEGVARIAMDRRNMTVARPAPVYLRPADAAPSRDPAPIVLP